MTKTEMLQGILPALPTPLTKKGELDTAGLEKLLRHVLAGGVHGLWVLGSTSEFTTLSHEERDLVIEISVRAAGQKTPVIVGVTENDPKKVVRNAEEAYTAGADACFTVLPFYFSVDVQEAVRFIRMIAEAIPLPLILYDNPFATQVKLNVNRMVEFSDCPNLIAIKESSADFVRFQDLLFRLRTKGSCKLLQGIEPLVWASLLCGADGAIVALASIAPSLFVKLWESATVADTSNLLSLQKQVLTLCRLLDLTGAPTDGAFFAGMKAALEVLGICGRTVSTPFSVMPANKMAEVEKLLHECQVTLLA